jgi:microcompartment protein CcmK/EutM
MQIARVIGSVVSTSKSEKLYGLKLLLVKPIDLDTFEEKGSAIVGIDTVGAGEGEIVMIVSGSSSRQTEMTSEKPADCAIIAIIDYIDVGRKRIFSKDEDNVKKEV